MVSLFNKIICLNIFGISGHPEKYHTSSTFVLNLAVIPISYNSSDKGKILGKYKLSFRNTYLLSLFKLDKK